jgi:hypothetical protein
MVLVSYSVSLGAQPSPEKGQAPMPRKQRTPHSPFNVIHLRVDDELNNRLKVEADRRRIPVSREIRNRLLDSFEQDVQRGWLELLLDMQISWGRFRAHYLTREAADKIADALMADADTKPELKVLAQQIIDMRAVEQRKTKWGAP